VFSARGPRREDTGEYGNGKSVLPCEGGFEYFHRSPVSRRKQRKGNPVPVDITRPPDSWEKKYGNLPLQVGGVSNQRQ
jgi:hypothetical protein